jgi:hypothetical protein
MAESTTNNETRDDVLHVPNLFDFFCQRTAADMRARGGAGDAPATSFAGLIIIALAAVAFYVFGRPQMAKATFVLFGGVVLWTVWGAVIRSGEQVSQKADSIKAGVFPPDSAPFVLARLKWWNHLVVPMRWGRHSRLFDRRSKLERKIEELRKRITEAVGRAGQNAAYAPPADAEVFELAERINNSADRNEYESGIPSLPDEVARLRAELALYLALLHKLEEMSDRLERIEKLSVVFQNVSAADLSAVVSEAIQVLEERRILVLNVDNTDPDSFIDLVSVRAS